MTDPLAARRTFPSKPIRPKVPALSLEQTAALDLCTDFNERLVGITGGAGTGKTLVLGEVYHDLTKAFGPASTALCAPTGRAAKRIQELTGIPAKTVHRLLEFPMPDEDLPEGQDRTEPRRNRNNPLPYRFVIVDEASMIGPTLYRQLLDAMPAKGCLRFFGDNNQLPPVDNEGQEAPFVAVLKTKASITLTFNFRSTDEIISNAIRILQGHIPVRNSRFEIIYSENPLLELLRFVTPELGQTSDFTRSDHQIITPTRKGKFGTLRINPSLQVQFNPTGPLLRLDRMPDRNKAESVLPEAPLTVRTGDKFLWIKNDYNLDLFNGEIGTIDYIDEHDGSLNLRTPDKLQAVPARMKIYSAYHGSVITYDPRRQIELGYAVTTHKSQGSEFDTVVYVMCAGQGWLLDRRNFYTGVTRAKSNVIIITDRAAMGRAMRKGD